LRADGAGQDWYESRAQVPTLLYLDESEVGGNAGKKAGFTASASGNAYVTQEFSSAQTGTFSVQWDIYVDTIADIGDPDRTGFMLLGADLDASGGPSRSDGERFVYMAFHKDGGAETGTADLVAMSSFSSFTTVAADLNLDQWYTIKVDVDVAAGTYDVYVDDVLVAADVAACTALASVTHISFAQWNDGAGAFYVDNVFSPPVDTYKLSVAVVGDGTVDVNPGESSYVAGSEVLLTPSAGEGYVFDRWELDGVPDGSEVPYTVTMDSDHTVTAVFTAEGNVVPEISGAEPADAATGVSVSTSLLNFTVSDADGDLMDIYLSTVPDVGSGSALGVSDGTYSLTVSGLEYSTTYTWWVNVTDGTDWTNSSFTFTTEDEQVPLLVDSQFDDSTSSTDLRDNTEGQDWYESRNAVPSTMLYLDETNIGGNTGKKAGFAGSTAQNAYMSQEFSSAQTGTFSVQWDIYVDSIENYGSTDASGWMFIGDNSAGDLEGGFDKGPNSATTERFMNMYFYKLDGGTTGTMQLRIRQSNPSATTTIATLNLDQWYTIKVVCDVESDTVMVYVDGVEYGPYRAYTNKTSVTHISFATWNDGPGVFYVDNVYAPARDTYVIVASAGEGGSIVPSGSVVVADGADQTFIITSDTGYQVLDVLVDGSSVGAVTTYTFEDVVADHTIEASFELIGVTHTIVASAGAGGSIDPVGDVIVADGADQAFTITADSGYEIADVLVDGISEGAISEYTFTSVTSDHTIEASFSLLPTGLIVDSDFEASADSTDLRDNTEGQDWYESRNDVPAILYLDETDVEGNAGKKAGFTEAIDNAYLTQEFSVAQTGSFSVQWDIYVDTIADIGDPDRTGFMLLGADLDASGGPSRSDGERFVYMAFHKDGGATTGTADLVAMSSFSSFTTVAADLNLDQWYTIKVEVDVTAGTYDVYVDGVLVAADVAACTALASVTHISFAQWNDGAGAFYVDNVFSPSQD